MTLSEFNSLPSAEAEAVLFDCCGCTRWSRGLSAQRPFNDVSSLFEAANTLWSGLGRENFLEAFSHHPRIGEKPDAGSASARNWAAGEQAGVRVATDDVKTRMIRGNRAYHDKFGYIYIVCATGKSAEQMLALLEDRLQNDPADELGLAAEQQRQITRLRMEKLFAGERIL